MSLERPIECFVKGMIDHAELRKTVAKLSINACHGATRRANPMGPDALSSGVDFLRVSNHMLIDDTVDGESGREPGGA